MLKNVSRIEKLVLSFVAIVTLAGFALSYINHDLFKQYFVVEDGFTEWMTVLALLVGMVVGLPAGSSQAATIYLDIFTDNGDFADDSAVDLFVKVTEYSGQARVELYNGSSVNSTIAEIYFDDSGGVLSEIADIVGPGTSFSEGGSPGHLPAGNDLSPAFQTPADFMASADNPAPTNGVNPGEDVAILFEVNGCVCHVVKDLEDGTLRIGLHVIAFSDGSSESATTPEPATMALMLAGSLMLLRRRRKD